MSTHRIAITPDWPPGAGHVELDGHDITDAIRGTAITMDAAGPPLVTLRLNVVELDGIDSKDAQVFITDDTREALIKLGWTPPGEVGDG